MSARFTVTDTQNQNADNIKVSFGGQNNPGFQATAGFGNRRQYSNQRGIRNFGNNQGARAGNTATNNGNNVTRNYFNSNNGQTYGANAGNGNFGNGGFGQQQQQQGGFGQQQQPQGAGQGGYTAYNAGNNAPQQQGGYAQTSAIRAPRRSLRAGPQSNSNRVVRLSTTSGYQTPSAVTPGRIYGGIGTQPITFAAPIQARVVTRRPSATYTRAVPGGALQQVQQPQQIQQQPQQIQQQQEDAPSNIEIRIEELEGQIAEEFGRIGFEDKNLYDDVQVSTRDSIFDIEEDSKRRLQEAQEEAAKQESIADIRGRIAEINALIKEKVLNIRALKVRLRNKNKDLWKNPKKSFLRKKTNFEFFNF